MRSVMQNLCTDLSCVNFQEVEGFVSEKWDMVCPETGSFPSAACLRKTMYSDGACVNKGCPTGNEIRAKSGLPPIEKKQHPQGEGTASSNFRQGKKRARCACGRMYYGNDIYTECALCRHKRALLKAKSSDEKRILRHKISTIQGAAKRGGR